MPDQLTIRRYGHVLALSTTSYSFGYEYKVTTLQIINQSTDRQRGPLCRLVYELGFHGTLR